MATMYASIYITDHATTDISPGGEFYVSEYI